MLHMNKNHKNQYLFDAVLKIARAIDLYDLGYYVGWAQSQGANIVNPECYMQYMSLINKVRHQKYVELLAKQYAREDRIYGGLK